jgi:hypothetical protein
MSFLPVLHEAATAASAAGALYAVSVALAAVTSLAAPSRERRDEARETLKILLRGTKSSTGAPSTGNAVK